jgi:hypothetical protein
VLFSAIQTSAFFSVLCQDEPPVSLLKGKSRFEIVTQLLDKRYWYLKFSDLILGLLKPCLKQAAKGRQLERGLLYFLAPW